MKDAAKRKAKDTTENTEDIEKKGTMGTVREDITVIVKAVLGVDLIVAAIVLADIKKIHGEDSSLKRKKEKNLKNTRKN